MVQSITEVLNVWNDMGVFSYVLPFLLIFAVVFAILDKTRMFSPRYEHEEDYKENKAIIAIISVSIGLLSLQFDFVSEFFAVIFPRFGIGLAVFLVIVIFLGFFYSPRHYDHWWSNKVSWIGWVVGIGVIIWSLSEWDEWQSYIGFGGWFSDNIWSLIVLGIIIAIIAVAAGGTRDKHENIAKRDNDKYGNSKVA